MSQSKAQRIAVLVALLATQTAKAEATKVRLAAAEASKEETAGADAIEAGLPAGTVVDFRFGRGEKVRHYIGTVIGSKPQDKGPTLYRVRVGEGFDEEIFKVFGAQITGHNFVATVDATEAGADPLDFASDNA